MVNSEVDRFNRSILKSIRATHSEGKCWKQELYSFLRNYINTPHAATQKIPVELLFGKQHKTRLPQLPTESTSDDDVRNKDTEAKQKMKTYADRRNHAATRLIKIGDRVLVKQNKRNNLSAYFNNKPYTVIAIEGTMITAKGNNYQITRNSSWREN